MIRLDDDHGFGVSVDAVGTGKKRRFFVSCVDPGGPAWRAGIKGGEAVRGYTTEYMNNKHRLWDECASVIMEAAPTRTIFSIQLRIRTLGPLQEKRRAFVVRQKTNKRGAYPSTNIDWELYKWDMFHFKSERIVLRHIPQLIRPPIDQHLRGHLSDLRAALKDNKALLSDIRAGIVGINVLMARMVSEVRDPLWAIEVMALTIAAFDTELRRMKVAERKE